MSKFIDGSKDPNFNSAVEHHFANAVGRAVPATVGGFNKRWPMGKDVSAEFLNGETGVNHRSNGATGKYPRG